MYEKLTCSIVKDILPLYMDGLVSEESAAAIRQHMETCADCRDYFEHMQSDLLEQQVQEREHNQKEIDYLKKIKKTTVKRTVLGAVLALLLCAALVSVKLFVIGSPDDSYFTTYVDVYDDSLHVGGTFTGSAAVYRGYKIEEADGGSRLVIYSCLASPWNREGAFNLDIPREEIQGDLRINDLTVAGDGTVISPLAQELYEHKNPYVGNASADGLLSQTLGIANELGNFTNELQTGDEPYGWTLRFENSTNNSAIFNEKMKGFACVLIALTDNLGEVSWEYTVELADGPAVRREAMTEEDCTAYLGAPVKEYAQSPKTVQALLQLLTDEYGLSFYRTI